MRGTITQGDPAKGWNSSWRIMLMLDLDLQVAYMNLGGDFDSREIVEPGYEMMQPSRPRDPWTTLLNPEVADVLRKRDMLQRFFFLALLLAAGCKPAPKTTAFASFDDLDYGLPVESTMVDGTDLAYVDMGRGPQTLVLIHGLGSYLPAWSKNLQALSAEYRVIALDLPGYGRSDKPNAPYSMRYFVAKVRGLLHELGVEHPVLVGHSMGGQISLTYALLYPDEVQGLVLASPAGLETFEDGEAKWLANAVTPEFTCLASDEAIYSRHVGNFYTMPKDAEFMVDDRVAMKSAAEFPDYCVAVSRSVAGMLDEPVHERLPNLRVPTLVTFGKLDNLIPNPFLRGGSTKGLVEREAQRIPGAKLVMLPKAGHMAHYEQAELWNREVLQFVRQLPLPSAPEPEPAARTRRHGPAALRRSRRRPARSTRSPRTARARNRG